MQSNHNKMQMLIQILIYLNLNLKFVAFFYYCLSRTFLSYSSHPTLISEITSMWFVESLGI